MLTAQEQNDLYALISAIIGDDPSIRNYKSSFNDQTIDVVEDMIQANIHCNKSMKDLLSGLLSGGRALAKGWLKKSLGTAKKKLKNQGGLNGQGCLVSTKARWKQAIILTAT